MRFVAALLLFVSVVLGNSGADAQVSDWQNRLVGEVGHRLPRQRVVPRCIDRHLRATVDAIEWELRLRFVHRRVARVRILRGPQNRALETCLERGLRDFRVATDVPDGTSVRIPIRLERKE